MVENTKNMANNTPMFSAIVGGVLYSAISSSFSALVPFRVAFISAWKEYFTGLIHCIEYGNFGILLKGKKPPLMARLMVEIVDPIVNATS